LVEHRFELASSYARMGANDEAVGTLLAMIAPSAEPLLATQDPASALDLLERTLGAERRPEEALVVSELRAILGDLDEARSGWLKQRRLGPLGAHHLPLDRNILLNNVVPRPGNHALVEVAAAVAGLESRLLRADFTELGISPRDRIAARSGHPVRILLDRIARALPCGAVELAVSASVSRTRVLVLDEPWIVLPMSIMEKPEATQVAVLARAVSRIALGVPWLEELPPPHVEAYLVACARQVLPTYGQDEVDVIASRLVAQYEPSVNKNLSRKQRKALEDLVPRLSMHEARPVPIEEITQALSLGEMRCAHILCGDLLAVFDELRSLEPSLHMATQAPGRNALAAMMRHTYAADVARFALAPESPALRRRVGSTWAS
jgi:hypothetical protein